MFVLWYLLQEHGQRLEADFQRFYNLDLADLYRGRLGARKASVLAANLPPESATMRAEGGDGSLSITEHELRALSYKASLLLFQNGGGKGTKPKPPQSPQRHADRKQQDARLKANAERSMRQHQRKIGALAS